MISNQIIQTSLDELRAITRVDLCVYDLTGDIMASTVDKMDISTELVRDFADSPADSQVIGIHHLLKVLDEGELVFILVARGMSDDVYMVGKIAVCQLQNLVIAYKERFDRNNFFQNLLLDNLLLVDIYNRAKKLHVEESAPRAVYLIEARQEKDGVAKELLKGMFTNQTGDYITAVDESSIILIKAVEGDGSQEELEAVAKTIVDMMNTEAMLNVTVAYGNVVQELKDVSKSYKEAKMALDVGKIFYAEKNVIAYSTLGIGRLIYQLPINLCKIFIDEIFGENVPADLDEESRRIIEQMTKMIVRKLLREPMKEINASAGTERENFYIKAMTKLFKLEMVGAAANFEERHSKCPHCGRDTE